MSDDQDACQWFQEHLDKLDALQNANEFDLDDDALIFTEGEGGGGGGGSAGGGAEEEQGDDEMQEDGHNEATGSTEFLACLAVHPTPRSSDRQAVGDKRAARASVVGASLSTPASSLVGSSLEDGVPASEVSDGGLSMFQQGVYMCPELACLELAAALATEGTAAVDSGLGHEASARSSHSSVSLLPEQLFPKSRTPVAHGGHANGAAPANDEQQQSAGAGATTRRQARLEPFEHGVPLGSRGAASPALALVMNLTTYYCSLSVACITVVTIKRRSRTVTSRRSGGPRRRCVQVCACMHAFIARDPI